MGGNSSKDKAGGGDSKSSATLSEQEGLAKVTVINECFSAKERDQLLKLVAVKQYKDGEAIIKQGDDGSEFFMIRSVRCRSVRSPHARVPWGGPPLTSAHLLLVPHTRRARLRLCWTQRV
jgi:hypothetical protein